MRIVVTGVLESIERDACKELLERLGAKVTESVSRKTTHVVAGRDAGPKKLANAHEFGLVVLNEDGLFQLIRERERTFTNAEFQVVLFDAQESALYSALS